MINKVSYCIGWSLDGPIYCTHFLGVDNTQNEYINPTEEYKSRFNNDIVYKNKTLQGRGK